MPARIRNFRDLVNPDTGFDVGQPTSATPPAGDPTARALGPPPGSTTGSTPGSAATPALQQFYANQVAAGKSVPEIMAAWAAQQQQQGGGQTPSGGGDTSMLGGGWNQFSSPAINALKQGLMAGKSGQSLIDELNKNPSTSGIAYYADKGQYGIPGGYYVASHPDDPSKLDLIQRGGGGGGGGMPNNLMSLLQSGGLTNLMGGGGGGGWAPTAAPQFGSMPMQPTNAPAPTSPYSTGTVQQSQVFPTLPGQPGAQPGAPSATPVGAGGTTTGPWSPPMPGGMPLPDYLTGQGGAGLPWWLQGGPGVAHLMATPQAPASTVNPLTGLPMTVA
jgi:hypothetical protein